MREDPVDIMIRDIPFTVESLVEKVTEPGSFGRALGKAVCRSIRADVERYVEAKKAEVK